MDWTEVIRATSGIRVKIWKTKIWNMGRSMSIEDFFFGVTGLYKGIVAGIEADIEGFTVGNFGLFGRRKCGGTSGWNLSRAGIGTCLNFDVGVLAYLETIW